MKHGRRDEHHVRAGELARAAGFSTADMGDHGDGFPDWVWGKHAINFIVEIKTGEKAPLQPKQAQMAATWRGQWVRADTPEEAVELAEAYVASFSKLTTGARWNRRPPLSVAMAKKIAGLEREISARRGRPRSRKKGR